MTRELVLSKVGSNIARLRKDAGLSQVDLGLRCGKSKQNINRIEKGQHNLSVYILYEIAEALKVSAKDLLDFE